MLNVREFEDGKFVVILVAASCHDATAPVPTWRPSLVVQWDSIALEAVRRTRPGPPMVARDLAVVHTAMYDAWAAYDERAVGTRQATFVRG